MKKVLSFVLVLTLVLGSFSMVFAAPAHTALSDVAGTANEQAITVVNDLGIVEGCLLYTSIKLFEKNLYYLC